VGAKRNADLVGPLCDPRRTTWPQGKRPLAGKPHPAN
jgi:hypothetical protein